MKGILLWEAAGLQGNSVYSIEDQASCKKISGYKAAFKKVDKARATCHVKFRDREKPAV